MLSKNDVSVISFLSLGCYFYSNSLKLTMERDPPLSLLWRVRASLVLFTDKFQLGGLAAGSNAPSSFG